MREAGFSKLTRVVALTPSTMLSIRLPTKPAVLITLIAFILVGTPARHVYAQCTMSAPAFGTLGNCIATVPSAVYASSRVTPGYQLDAQQTTCAGTQPRSNNAFHAHQDHRQTSHLLTYPN
jgi:hypothetical protein